VTGNEINPAGIDGIVHTVFLSHVARCLIDGCNVAAQAQVNFIHLDELFHGSGSTLRSTLIIFEHQFKGVLFVTDGYATRSINVLDGLFLTPLLLLSGQNVYARQGVDGP
jgi:hypothetical protein